MQIYLTNGNTDLDKLVKPYMICSVNATVKILKRFVAKKIGMDVAKHQDLDILCNKEILGRDHTLLFVLVTRWRSKAQPLILEYRPRIPFL